MIFSPSAQDWAQLGLLVYHWATSKTHECTQVRVHVCEYLFRPEGNDRHLPQWFTTLVLRHCHKLCHHFVKISWGVNPNDLCGPVPFPPLALGFQDHATTHSAERSNSMHLSLMLLMLVSHLASPQVHRFQSFFLNYYYLLANTFQWWISLPSMWKHSYI